MAAHNARRLAPSAQRRLGLIGSAGLIGLAAIVTTAVIADWQPAAATTSAQSHVALQLGAKHPVKIRVTPEPTISATPTSTPTPTTSSKPTGVPSTLWVDPANPAAAAQQTLRSHGRSADANQLGKIATRATAIWLTGSADAAVAKVKKVVTAATAAGQLPVFVLYHLPNRDCGGYSSGGASSAADYRSWITAVAGAIGANYAEVIVEPDAVAMAASRSCATATASGQSELVAGAVSSLARLAHTTVYLDAGHSAWVSNVATLANSLRAAGLAQADGFALNVSNFQTLAASLAYGDKVSAATGGKHYVVDTSRNGAGPLPSSSGYAGPSWCNPPGRALGAAPTLHTGHGLADAYLWVKYPGASDGSCGLGDPSAGSFWTDYALGLAQRSS